MTQNQSSHEPQLWECKQCHQVIADEENVAYHLIDGFLYGWCERCFSTRHAGASAAA
jgi:hypothetical protein